MATPPFQDPVSTTPFLPETDLSNPNFTKAFENLPLPPLDSLFPNDLSTDLTFPEGFMSDLNFDDDFDFSLDDLILPSENDQFLLQDEFPNSSSSDSAFKVGSGVSDISQVSGNRSSDLVVLSSISSGNIDWEFPAFGSGDRSEDLVRVSNSLESCTFDPARVSNSPQSGTFDAARVSNSPESGTFDAARVSNSPQSGTFDAARVSNSPQPGTFDAAWVSNSPQPGTFDAARVLNSHSSKSCNSNQCLSGSISGNSDREFSASLPGDRSSDVVRFLNSQEPVTIDAIRVLNSHSSESGNSNRECSAPVARSSDVIRVLNSPLPSTFDATRTLNSHSPDSGNSGQCFSGSISSSLDSNNSADQKLKSEEESNASFLKRKKEKEDGNPNPRSSKFHRSICSDDVNANSQYVFQAGNEEEEKKKTRLLRNKESAQLSRQRKKHYVEELEDKVRLMRSTITDLNSKILFFMAENASLRQQLGGGGPPPGMYPPPPIPTMHYPWVPGSYALKPQGSQVPLLPIPRLKPKQPVSTSKAKSKKVEGKTKKVASVSFLGLLFFLLIFGGLVPVVKFIFGGSRDMASGTFDFVNSGFGSQSQGEVILVTGRLNGSDHSDGSGLYSGKMEFGKGKLERAGSKRGGDGVMECEVKQKEHRESGSLPFSDEFSIHRNDSEPLVASLYVPRNDKLVKIDGNLIIQSVLASEKAVASSPAMSALKGDKATMPTDTVAGKTGLAVAGNVASALALSKDGRDEEKHSQLYRSPAEGLKALPSGSGDAYENNLKSAATDGPLQQWFREGLAGPIFSSGMCTELFQFEVANPGAIIPATSVANISEQCPPHSGRANMKSARILYPPPIPLPASVHNKSQEHARKPPGESNFGGNKSAPSMVVSVLVDPKEAGVDADGMISTKSLSRIFVVVLLDSVKYVTYSCVLPIKGAAPRHVTT
ncbi:bZIP transcription factor 17-like [Tasmannia lanceolata]|uniref:bZIP transcription factor 17-like n=1 Tax=Tasmannia lanceolata TaxID=3420 RepID=UPI0040630C97